MIKQYVPSKVCLKCQGCCRFSQNDSIWSVRLLDKEQKKLLKNKISFFFIGKDKRIIPQPLAETHSFICSLLNPKDNKCKIYKIRPFECQIYPFILRCHHENFFLAIHLHCPLMKDGLDSKNFKQYSNYLGSLLNSSHYLKLLKDNPQLFQPYEDALDVSELEI